MYLIGIDVGTTHWKVVAYDRRGEAAAAFRCPGLVRETPDGGAVHDPEELWQAVAGGIREVVAALPARSGVTGVAVASVGEAGVLLDRADRPVGSSLVWYDPRTEPQARAWRERFPDRELYAVTGFAPQHIASVNKLVWLRENEPFAFARAAHWLCLADYVAFRLSGEKVMDYSLASRTGLFDLHRREWSGRLLAGAELDLALFPPLAPSGTAIGGVTRVAAALTGLAEGTPVCTGGHDHICGALAAGVAAPGAVLDSTGTAEAVLTVLDAPVTAPELCQAGLSLGCHVARGRYYLLGTIATAGAVVEWLKDLLGEDYAGLTARAAAAPPGSDGLLFLPHLRGTVLPVDPLSRGAFVGLTAAHTKSHLARAALEGVCHELRALLTLLAQFSGTEAEPVTAVGGAVKNPFWLRLKADVTGREFLVPEVEEATALGAALLAGLGTGVWTTEREAAQALARRATRLYPEAETAAAYALAHRVYLKLYPLLKGVSAEIATGGGG
ncbi:MAG: FGGY-family carbohydrate kinase [Methanocella sp.]